MLNVWWPGILSGARVGGYRVLEVCVICCVGWNWVRRGMFAGDADYLT